MSGSWLKVVRIGAVENLRTKHLAIAVRVFLAFLEVKL